MRVFYAVTFTEKTKEKLKNIKYKVEKNSKKGKFSNYKNYHITLQFIGNIETKELDKLKEILYKLNTIPKTLVFNKIGSFKRKNKEIIWIGIEKNDKLIVANNELKTILKNHDYKVDEREFKPHLTIGRQVELFNPIEDISMNYIKVPIKSIALMESKRIEGILVYEPLEEIKLKI